ncbi:lazarillo protein-like [Cloeon dipterum]|uniref:lazarillo protein-like n=1 Tax=Cloeon dipterum TaxID=197152 RepID=UPI00322059D1
MISLAVFSLVLVGASTQIIQPGPCPPLTVQQNFDLPAYLDRWYQQKKYFNYFEENGICNTATYTLNPNETVAVRNYLFNTVTQEPDTILGYATVGSDSGEAKLLVSFPSVGNYDSPYWVLETDYTRFSVVWSCSEFATENLQFAWVLTRERFPDDATLAEIERVIADNQLADRWEITPNDNCPEDP